MQITRYKDMYRKGVDYATYGATGAYIPDFANEKEEKEFWQGVKDTYRKEK